MQFNIGSTQLELIGNLLTKSSVYYGRGDIPNWYFCLKSIKLRIFGKLNKEERIELNKMENSIVVCRNKGLKKAMHILVEKYDNRIMELLDVKGYSIPLKEDTTNVFGQEYEEG